MRHVVTPLSVLFASLRGTLVTVCLTFATVSLIAPAAHAAGPYDAARAKATRALKAATRQIDSVSSCAQTQGANIRDAMRQVKALRRGAASDTYEGINLFLGGLALGGALSGCPNALYGHLTMAQTAITEMQNASSRGVRDRMDDHMDDEGEDEEEEGARAPEITIGDVDVDADFIDQTRSPAILFHASAIQASGFAGAKVKWSLLVKRKAAKWNKATSYSIGDARIARDGALGDVSISVRYASFERDGFSSGAHVAAVVGVVGKTQVARAEVPFTLSLDVPDDVVRRAPRAPSGPAAMSTSAFAGFVAALHGASTDYSKADMIKKAAAKNHFTAHQLGQLLDTLTTDFSKVDACKAVVPKLVDTENAYGLADKFSTSFSKQEFTALL
jgi:hypothetical protein